MARRRTASKDRKLPMAQFGLKPSDAACSTATSGLLNVVEICSREVVQSLYANLVGPTRRHQFDAIRRRFSAIGRTDRDRELHICNLHQSDTPRQPVPLIVRRPVNSRDRPQTACRHQNGRYASPSHQDEAQSGYDGPARARRRPLGSQERMRAECLSAPSFHISGCPPGPAACDALPDQKR